MWSDDYTPELMSEIFEKDQGLRSVIVEKSKTLLPSDPELKSLWQEQTERDESNQKIISEMLDEHGWPSSEYKTTIPSNSDIVFLVIQHADLDYQLKYIDMVRQATESGKLEPSSYALLQDRVLMKQGKEQIYGSQLNTDPVTGKNSFMPIADEENVNKRRAEVGLEPIEEYAKYFGVEYKKK